MKDFKEFCNETLIPVLIGIGCVVWYIITLPFDIIKDILLAVWCNLYSRADMIFEFPNMVEEFTKD